MFAKKVFPESALLQNCCFLFYVSTFAHQTSRTGNKGPGIEFDFERAQTVQLAPSVFQLVGLEREKFKK
jgi:hypothetical protein